MEATHPAMCPPASCARRGQPVPHAGKCTASTPVSTVAVANGGPSAPPPPSEISSARAAPGCPAPRRQWAAETSGPQGRDQAPHQARSNDLIAPATRAGSSAHQRLASRRSLLSTTSQGGVPATATSTAPPKDQFTGRFQMGSRAITSASRNVLGRQANLTRPLRGDVHGRRPSPPNNRSDRPDRTQRALWMMVPTPQ